MLNCIPSVPVTMLLSLAREIDSTSSSLTVARVAWDDVRRRSLSLPPLAFEAVLFVVARDTWIQLASELESSLKQMIAYTILEQYIVFARFSYDSA